MKYTLFHTPGDYFYFPKREKFYSLKKQPEMTGFGNSREAWDEHVLKIVELSEMWTLGSQYLSPFLQLLTKQPSKFFSGEIKKYWRKNIHKLILGGGSGDRCLSRKFSFLLLQTTVETAS